MNHTNHVLTDQRGVALPMAMLVLLILSTLILGFSVLSATEPVIANNQAMVAQARAIAEAGIEQAIWALSHPTNPKGIPTTIPLPASWTAVSADGTVAYNGSQLVLVSTGGTTMGGFKVTIAAATTIPYPTECKPASSMSSGELCIVARGYVPDDTASPKASQKIAVTIFNPQFVFRDPPAALSVRGELDAGGNSLMDSRSDTSCGKKVGTISTGSTDLIGNATDIWGAADNNLIRNEFTDAANGPLPPNAHDIVKNLATASFDQFILTDADINALRVYAKWAAAQTPPLGTYLQGSVTFDASNKIPNGIVFVDTTTGTNITQEGVTPPTPSPQFADVQIMGNPPADPSGIFSGYLFVNGTLSIDGNFRMNGMMYAQNDIVYHGIGAGGVYGAAMSRNIRDTSFTSIDSDVLGNALINYNCAYAKSAGGQFQNKWSFETGTYKELSGT